MFLIIFSKQILVDLSVLGRNNPAIGLVAGHEKEDINSSWELSGKLMRINHSGEVAAQGLYQGQLFLETDPSLRDYLDKAAKEEADHLMD